ncbi:MAG: heavy metal translocating P-type ATPase [Gemmatimonadales bacterium]
MIDRGAAALPAGSLLCIAAGLAVRYTAGPGPALLLWSAGLAVTGAPVVWTTIRTAAAGHFAADLVASFAIVGALLLGEPLAGLVVVLMQTGGEALERYAEGRASAAVRELEAAAPRVAHRLERGEPEDVPVDVVGVGDLLLVRPGELIPCDLEVVGGGSSVDTSRLTGEPMPVAARPGSRLLSGSLNLDGVLEARVLAPAGESQYARIVELVRSAQASKSPLQRLADRYAVWFTPLTLVICGGAWILSGDPVRALAVLVVATPCPLILATPVAIIGGINRAARHGIIFRHGGALEQLGQVSVAVFDKTGTLTVGHPEVAQVVPAPSFTADEMLRLAAGVEQGSGHPLARPVVAAARARGLTLPEARGIVEAPGQGVGGRVDGREVAVGGRTYLTARHPGIEEDLRALRGSDGRAALRAFVVVDGKAAGIIEYADGIRPELEGLVTRLRTLGLRHVVLLSGDDRANTDAVAHAIGIEEAHGELLPQDKVAHVRRLAKAGEKVLMVGDGTNDAPALSSATVGVALASGGGGITAEAADVVLLADDPSRVVTAIAISRRTVHLAHQSIWVGLGLSACAMAAASLGYVPPTLGALLQEAIDVGVILNALRAATGKDPTSATATTDP